MADKSLIEWCDATINPAYGCTKCGAACDHCYAERLAARFSANPDVEHLVAGTVDASGHWTGKVNLWPERMEQALHWRKPRRIFVGSMTDLFHPAVPFEFLDRIFAVMAMASPQHTFMLLTKRPERMAEYLGYEYRRERIYKASGESDAFCLDWSLPNVWLGTTIWDQDSADRAVPILLSTPAAKRFVSVEPMLGPVVIPAELLARLAWVICGGETGPKARPMHPDWPRKLRDDCVAAGVPFFFKQWGEWAPHLPELGYDNPATGGRAWGCINRDGEWMPGTTPFNGDRGDYEWPMVRVGQRRAGRKLDGRTWEEVPG